MKRKLSLKTRLMITTSFLLVGISIVFSVFSLFNAYFNIIRPLEGTFLHKEEFVLNLDRFFNANLIFLVVSISIGCGLTYLVARFSLKPLTIWSEEMEHIDQTQLSKRIQNSNTRDELDKLANAFNQLLDRLQKAFDREKRFSAAAAHELKTPLTVVKANIEFLQLEEKPAIEEYAETIEVISKQNERMITLVNDLMLLSSTKAQEQKDTIDLDAVIAEIEKELKPALLEENITFTYNKAGFHMKGNATLIKHALSNLIQNAIKYNIDNGAITVSQTVGENQYQIAVSDTGIGIKEEDIPYIFEPFYRADKSRNRAVGGSGLGLAITKEIIESHGGSVEYRKREPQGSVLEVRIAY